MRFKRAKITRCQPKDSYVVWVEFDDGLTGEIDLAHLAGKGVFRKVWKTVEDFKRVRVNPESSTLTWGEGEEEVDLDPYVLRQQLEKHKDC